MRSPAAWSRTGQQVATGRTWRPIEPLVRQSPADLILRQFAKAHGADALGCDATPSQTHAANGRKTRAWSSSPADEICVRRNAWVGVENAMTPPSDRLAPENTSIPSSGNGERSTGERCLRVRYGRPSKQPLSDLCAFVPQRLWQAQADAAKPFVGRGSTAPVTIPPRIGSPVPADSQKNGPNAAKMKAKKRPFA